MGLFMSPDWSATVEPAGGPDLTPPPKSLGGPGLAFETWESRIPACRKAGGPDLTLPTKFWVAQVSLLRPGRQQTSLRANAYCPKKIKTSHHRHTKKPRFRQTHETKSLANQGQNAKNRNSALEKQPNSRDNHQISINLGAKSVLKLHAHLALFFAQKRLKKPFFSPILKSRKTPPIRPR